MCDRSDVVWSEENRRHFLYQGPPQTATHNHCSASDDNFYAGIWAHGCQISLILMRGRNPNREYNFSISKGRQWSTYFKLHLSLHCTGQTIHIWKLNLDCELLVRNYRRCERRKRYSKGPYLLIQRVEFTQHDPELPLPLVTWPWTWLWFPHCLVCSKIYPSINIF